MVGSAAWKYIASVVTGNAPMSGLSTAPSRFDTRHVSLVFFRNIRRPVHYVPPVQMASQLEVLGSFFDYQSRQVIVRSPVFQQLFEGVVP